MRIKFSSIVLFALLIFNNDTKSQECMVLADSLKGIYAGECKNGKAEGQGEATGVDVYAGEFKSGLPSGQGKYDWKNGDSYTGNWQKGNREGKGTMTYKLNADKDSIVNGYWKKDKFAGIYEKPYKIISNTVHITSIAAKKISEKYSQIDFYIDSETGKQFLSYSGEANPAPQITDISVISGTYIRLVQNPNLGKKISYSLEDVVFPFRALITIGNDAIEFEFYEPAKWSLDLRMAY